MKKIVFLAAMLFFTTSLVQAAIELSIEPTTQEVTDGSEVEVGILISGLGEFVPPSLGAYSIEVGYDSTLLSANHVIFGDPVLGNQLDLGFGSFVFSDVSNPGVVFLEEISFVGPLLDDIQHGRFTLATLSFDAVAAGTSPIDLDFVALRDSVGLPLDAVPLGGEVIIKSSTPVPVPAAVWLFGSGLLALIGLSREKKAA